MELTIEQALLQAGKAYKKGQLQEAERLYRAILDLQPAHPDANHNLGLLAVSVDKVDAALPLFKTALEANPRIEQFWLSYIDALIQENQFDNAKSVLGQAARYRMIGAKLDALEVKIASTNSQGNVSGLSPPHEQLVDLLEHYRAGRLDEAEKHATSLAESFPKHSFSWKILAAVNKKTNRVGEALAFIQQAVKLSPLDAEAHNNLASTLKTLGRLKGAAASYARAIELKPDYAEAHSNFGNTLRELGKLDEAAASYTQAIALKPDFAEAHSNYGNTLRELGRLEEAVASYTEAIALKPDYAEAHCNFGATLKELGRLEEAEASCRYSIKLQPELALAHFTLAKVLYNAGCTDLSVGSIEKATELDPKTQEYTLLLMIIKARKIREDNRPGTTKANRSDTSTGLASNPVILNRMVEADLISTLYEMNYRELDETTDARYGNGRCSVSFNLLQDKHPVIQKLAIDLTNIMKKVVKSDIYIFDSFFNILGAGGGSTPHQHLNALDKELGLNLSEQKYSLVYYLSVGDQDCSQPGMLKLYKPDKDILPCEGMITIIPATRLHSAVYSGDKDRVMIGVNFYSL